MTSRPKPKRDAEQPNRTEPADGAIMESQDEIQAVAGLTRELAALRSELSQLRDELAELNQELDPRREQGSNKVDVGGGAEQPLAVHPLLASPPSANLRPERWPEHIRRLQDLAGRVSAADVLAMPRARVRQLAAPLQPYIERNRIEGKDAVGTAAVTWWEVGIVAAIVLVAAFLRFNDLSTFPFGMHGDEANAGLDGRRILEEGWIGPYTPLSAGQPTGPLYLTAVAMWLFGETVFAVRFVPALMGTLTVLALYVVLRRNFGMQIAVAGAALLSIMSWHVHFGRVGYPLESWPLIVVVTVGVLMEALRQGGWRWWAMTGGLAALGMYVYNAHPMFLAILGLFVLYYFYGWTVIWVGAALALYAFAQNLLTLLLLAVALFAVLRGVRVGSIEDAARGSAFVLAAIVVLLPMAVYAADERNDYFSHSRRDSVFNQEPWITLDGTVDRTRFLVERYGEFWSRLCCRPVMDWLDATGATAIVPLSMVLLATVGLGLALTLRPGPLVSFGALVVLLMPLTAVVTEGGMARRPFAMAPFVAMFGGIAIVEILRLTRALGPRRRLPILAVLVLMVTLIVYRSLDNYYVQLPESPVYHSVYASEMVAASRYMSQLPGDSYVYFYSDRFPFGHELREFFAPNANGENRSMEYGAYSLDDTSAGRPVYIFLGTYRDRLGEVQELHPAGETVVEGAASDPVFIAYLPAVES